MLQSKTSESSPLTQINQVNQSQSESPSLAPYWSLNLESTISINFLWVCSETNLTGENGRCWRTRLVNEVRKNWCCSDVALISHHLLLPVQPSSPSLSASNAHDIAKVNRAECLSIMQSRGLTVTQRKAGAPQDISAECHEKWQDSCIC